MPANRVYVVLPCPRCGVEGEQEVEATIDGQGFARDYRIDEQVDWLFFREPALGGRPADGNLTTDGYVVCEACHKDFFVNVVVEHDRLVRVEVEKTKKGYIGDTDPEEA